MYFSCVDVCSFSFYNTEFITSATRKKNDKSEDTECIFGGFHRDEQPSFGLADGVHITVQLRVKHVVVRGREMKQSQLKV